MERRESVVETGGCLLGGVFRAREGNGCIHSWRPPEQAWTIWIESKRRDGSGDVVATGEAGHLTLEHRTHAVLSPRRDSAHGPGDLDPGRTCCRVPSYVRQEALVPPNWCASTDMAQRSGLPRRSSGATWKERSGTCSPAAGAAKASRFRGRRTHRGRTASCGRPEPHGSNHCGLLRWLQSRVSPSRAH